jgi:hypothetical protein
MWWTMLVAGTGEKKGNIHSAVVGKLKERYNL